MSNKYFTLEEYGQQSTNQQADTEDKRYKSVEIMVKLDGVQKGVSVSEFKQIMLEYDDIMFYKKLMEEIKKNGR